MNFPNIKEVTVDMNDRAQQLWLAGVGAVSRVRTSGEKLFADLVAEGAKVQRGARRDIDKTVTRLRKQADRRMNTVIKNTSKRVDGLENAFEKRIAAVLDRFEVPTRSGIDKLAREVEKLNREIKALEASRSRKAA